MKRVDVKTASVDRLKELNAAQLLILITMSGLAKSNHIDMNEANIEKVATKLGVTTKTVRNNLTQLAKKEIVFKAGTLSSYVVDPAIIVTDNEQKAKQHLDNVKTTIENFKRGVGKEKKNSKGDFEAKKLESELKRRKEALDDSKIVKEATEVFGKN